MDYVFLFLIHKNVDFVCHTCKKMEDENVYFYFHVDINSTENFDSLSKIKNSHFSKKRYPIIWAGPNLVYATYDCLCEIHDRHPEGYVILMSESDYPAKKIFYIKEYLAKQRKDYIVTQKLPCINPIEKSNCFWLEGGRRRYDCYALFLRKRWIATIEPRVLNWGNIRQFGKVIVKNPFQLCLAFKLWFKNRRKAPVKLEYYGGDQWFILRMKTVEKIIKYIEKRPSFLRNMSFTDTPDELFFQTLVGSLIRREERVSTTLRYINWPKIPSNSPEYLTLDDRHVILNQIINPNILFVRKVCDPRVAQFIDEKINGFNFRKLRLPCR